MLDPIPDPLSGKRILDWAMPVTRSLNGLHDKVGASARNERDRRAANKPLPYEVRFDATLDSGDGGWKIYLPTEHLLFWEGGYIALGGVTAIEDTNGDETGWFEFDDIDLEASHIWLVISESGSGSTVTAEFSDSSDAEAKASICIAEVSYTAATQSTPMSVEVNQSVVGAITLGGGGGGIISASGTVVISEDYVTSSGDSDFATHPYAMRIRRGTLTYNAATNALSIVEDPNLKQFIDTIEHSAAMDQT